MPSRTPLPVAGTCQAGHLTKRLADVDTEGRPRLTWRGTCPTDGCTAYVIARRVRPEPAPSTTPTTPAPAKTRRTVRKVTAYSEPEPEPPRARSHRPNTGVSTAPAPRVGRPEPDPGPVDDPAPLDDPGTRNPEPGQPGRRRPRLTRRTEYDLIPGIY